MTGDDLHTLSHAQLYGIGIGPKVDAEDEFIQDGDVVELTKTALILEQIVGQIFIQ